MNFGSSFRVARPVVAAYALATLLPGSAIAEEGPDPAKEAPTSFDGGGATNEPAPGDAPVPTDVPERSAMPFRLDLGVWWAWVYYAGNVSMSYAASPWFDVFANASARGAFALSPYGLRDVGAGVRLYPFEGFDPGSPIYVALGAAYRSFWIADDRGYETGGQFANTRYTGTDVAWTVGIGVAQRFSHLFVRFEPLSLQFRHAMIGAPGVNEPGIPVREDVLRDRTNWNFASHVAIGVAF
jgi:hypothetical protein